MKRYLVVAGSYEQFRSWLFTHEALEARYVCSERDVLGLDLPQWTLVLTGTYIENPFWRQTTAFEDVQRRVAEERRDP